MEHAVDPAGRGADPAARLRFLAEAGELLASSLDYERTLAGVARLAVPLHADGCAVDIVSDGRIRRLTAEPANPQRAALVHRPQQQTAPTPADRGVPRVVQTGEPLLVEDVAPAQVEQAAHGADPLGLPCAGDVRSYVVLPLRAGDAVLGALTFAQAESGRRFTRADLPFLEDLARRAAQAIRNAQLVRTLHETQERLRQSVADVAAARDDAERASTARAQFLAGMSHELRTPLNAIAGYTELLELGIPGALNDEQREVIGRIQRNQRRLLGLINDILNFTRLTGVRTEFPLEPVELQPLLSGLEQLIAPLLARRQIQYRCDAGAGHVRALTNPERLEQILLNLLSNAIKFTAPGGSIDVRCKLHDDHVAIDVTDSGRGIPPDHQVAIFDPFVQVDPEPARENAGIGLGLAISRELARALHADIELQSAPGAGSTFTLHLPPA